MTQSKGYAVIVDPSAPTREIDTITCFHCQRVVFLKVPGSDVGGFCRCCMKAICGPCADQGQCLPFEKKLEQYEKAAVQGRRLDALLRTG